MTPTTREKLLALWQRRPETRPEGLTYSDLGAWTLLDDGEYCSPSCAIAAALAVAKLVTHRMDDRGFIEIEKHSDGSFRSSGGTWQDTLLDALIAAAEQTQEQTR